MLFVIALAFAALIVSLIINGGHRQYYQLRTSSDQSPEAIMRKGEVTSKGVHSSVNGLRAMLVVNQKQWRRDKPLEIYAGLINESSKSVTVCNHLYLGTTVHIIFKQGDRSVRYPSMDMRMATPPKEEMMKLEPSEVVGKRYFISSSSGGSYKRWGKFIDAIPTGVNSVQFEYFLPEYYREYTGIPKLWVGKVTSNPVYVEVK